jgi:hypothetical protein
MYKSSNLIQVLKPFPFPARWAHCHCSENCDRSPDVRLALIKRSLYLVFISMEHSSSHAINSVFSSCLISFSSLPLLQGFQVVSIMQYLLSSASGLIL